MRYRWHRRADCFQTYPLKLFVDSIKHHCIGLSFQMGNKCFFKVRARDFKEAETLECIDVTRTREIHHV